MRISGIYQIQSKLKPERSYIGSSIDIKRRCYDHLVDLRSNQHHSKKLQRHYNKYGKDDLEFIIIESGEYLCQQHLLSREQGWYGHFQYEQTELPYFNSVKVAGSTIGYRHTKESLRKMSECKLGKPHTEEHNRKNSESNKGRRPSELTIRRSREVNTNKIVSSETREKQSRAKRGKTPYKAIENSIKARIGKKQSKETVQKRKETFKNRPFITCEFCGRESQSQSYMRGWHGENCKHKQKVA